MIENTDGNIYALNKYMEEQQAGEIAQENYLNEIQDYLSAIEDAIQCIEAIKTKYEGYDMDEVTREYIGELL